MRVRPRFLPLCLVPFLVNACATQSVDEPEAVAHAQQALGGIEGTFEYALDAPWRIEPVTDASGVTTYGAIPIQISIHDANLASADRGSFGGGAGVTRTLGNFCDVTVTPDGDWGSRIDFNQLADIESTTGPWTPTGAAPPHQVCRPSAGSCAALQNIGPTSEWHAGAWYQPRLSSVVPGSDLPLKLEARISREAGISCADTDPTHFYTLTNYVRVHLGEAPLPRFDNGYLYGDLHYHSQGTDNEGESGYNYRGVIRALGALGVDFAFATDHASSSEQIVDADLDWGFGSINATETGGVLRDMNALRFKTLHDELWKAGGVNDGALVAAGGSYPNGFRSHGVIPRIFLGGEVDAVPESTYDQFDTYPYGNGLFFDTRKNQCGGWVDTKITIDGACDPTQTSFDTGDALVFRDVQGIHKYGYSRSHLVTLPKLRSNTNAFVPSYTGKYGGGDRRLTHDFDGNRPLLPEIASKGYAFVAHPLPIGSCPSDPYVSTEWNGASVTGDTTGGKGPDGPPWTPSMLDQALSSPGILGLEFWNEDTRMCTQMFGEAKEIGYGSQSASPVAELDDDIKRFEREGFATGKFELRPYADMKTGAFQHLSQGVEWMLHHGAAQWDSVLRKGMDPSFTSTLGWLPAGEPRRMFIAGGSDAHGDFNYRREGYMLGTDKITDTAIAKVRNLVAVGAPVPETPIKPPRNFPYDRKGLLAEATADLTGAGALTGAASTDPTFADGSYTAPPSPPHTQDQVVATLANGNFSVTDGPALRIAIDRNRNGVIDDGDTPMGGIVELYGESTLPVIVEWKSTAEFGDVAEVQLYVGAQAGSNGLTAKTYAPKGHGPQAPGIASSAVYGSYNSNGRTYELMKDGYTADPTGLLRFAVPGGLGQGGVQKFNLPISAFEAGFGRRPDRLYVRAFADTTFKDATACLTTGGATGACIRRYAFTNPIWAIPGPRPDATTCPTGRPRAMDRDGDGYPDGCDACALSPDPAYCIKILDGDWRKKF